MHNPLATLKNNKPMKIIMYFIIFWVAAACGSVAGGMNIFCCTMNNTMVKIGRRLKYGPRAGIMSTPSINEPAPTLRKKPPQSQSMSGAARFEHQRIEFVNSGASRSSMATISERYSPMNTGI